MGQFRLLVAGALSLAFGAICISEHSNAQTNDNHDKTVFTNVGQKPAPIDLAKYGRSMLCVLRLSPVNLKVLGMNMNATAKLSPLALADLQRHEFELDQVQPGILYHEKRDEYYTINDALELIPLSKVETDKYKKVKHLDSRPKTDGELKPGRAFVDDDAELGRCLLSSRFSARGDKLIDNQTGKQTGWLPEGRWVGGNRLSVDGHRFYYMPELSPEQSATERIVVWDTIKQKVLATWPISVRGMGKSFIYLRQLYSLKDGSIMVYFSRLRND